MSLAILLGGKGKHPEADESDSGWNDEDTDGAEYEVLAGEVWQALKDKDQDAFTAALIELIKSCSS